LGYPNRRPDWVGAFLHFRGLGRRRNPFRMTTIQIYLKTKHLKSFVLIKIRKTRGEGCILLTEHTMKCAHPACPEPRREEPLSVTKDLLLLSYPAKGPCPEELILRRGDLFCSSSCRPCLPAVAGASNEGAAFSDEACPLWRGPVPLLVSDELARRGGDRCPACPGSARGSDRRVPKPARRSGDLSSRLPALTCLCLTARLNQPAHRP